MLPELIFCTTGLFINNTFVPSTSGKTLKSINPYDESPITEVASATADDVELAVTAAREAFTSVEWRGLTPSERGLLLLRLADLCEKQEEILATIDAWDNGKPYEQALGEDISEVISVFRYYGGWADKIHGSTIDTGEAKLAYTRREPVGVCGQIIPWNYPVMVRSRPFLIFSEILLKRVYRWPLGNSGPRSHVAIPLCSKPLSRHPLASSISPT
jgi:aldehyde dehydrogenase (NAD(P)+)